MSCAFGPNLIISESWPKANLPRSLATCIAAGQSVCCMMMSAPWSSSALAASASLPGSNQVLTQMILTLMLGLTVCAPSIVALMPETTSGNRERADIAEHAGLRHLRRDHALDVAALVPPRRIGRHVLVALVAGGVLEMHVGIFLGDLQRRVHVAERGREDQLVAGADQLLDGALGVGAFRHVLEIGGLDLVAEFLHQRLARQFVLIGPAEVADRAEIDEPDLQLVGGQGAAQGTAANAAASRSAAAAARNVFLIINLQTVGENQSSRTRRPIAHAPEMKSAVGHEHRAQRGRRGRAAGARARQAAPAR